jgi:hypothetical protein
MLFVSFCEIIIVLKLIISYVLLRFFLSSLVAFFVCVFVHPHVSQMVVVVSLYHIYTYIYSSSCVLAGRPEVIIIILFSYLVCVCVCLYKSIYIRLETQLNQSINQSMCVFRLPSSLSFSLQHFIL